jgi:hypothetical protein
MDAAEGTRKSGAPAAEQSSRQQRETHHGRRTSAGAWKLRRDRLRRFVRKNERFILFWAVLFLMVIFGYRLGLDRHVVAALAIAWGLGTQIFAAVFALVLGWLAAMPFLGPVLVKVITLPIVLLLNGLAFLASLVGVKIGHKRRVFESRVAATILLVGILIGYVLGKLF